MMQEFHDADIVRDERRGNEMWKKLPKSLKFQDTQIHYYQEAHGRSDGFYSRPSKFSDQTDLQTTWDLVIVERGVVL